MLNRPHVGTSAPIFHAGGCFDIEIHRMILRWHRYLVEPYHLRVRLTPDGSFTRFLLLTGPGYFCRPFIDDDADFIPLEGTNDHGV